MSKIALQDELKIHVKINSRYQILDKSGSVPFSITHRPQSFDVPCALANGLLKLLEGREETEVDLISFHAEAGPHQYVALPPPVQRAAHWTEHFEIFLNQIGSESDLARLLKPNTKYAIRLASTDLGIQWWSYSEPGEIPPGVTLSSENVSEAAKLVNSKESAGKAAFTTCDYLPSPPDLDIQLRIRPQSPSATTTDEDDNNSRGSACTLEVSITNTNAEHPVSIQSTGHQHFLVPWGPFQPVQIIDNRERLTSIRSASRSNLGKQNFIIHSRSDDTGSIVHRTTSPICGLVNTKTDRRPTRLDFTTLLPGKPFLRTFDLAVLLITKLRLPDGVYAIKLDALGAWWCWGSVNEVFHDGVEGRKRMEEEKEKEKEKIPEEAYKGLRPPVWLRSKDEVAVRIIDGRIVCK